ncbi:MAG: hypothetical protein CVT95_11685 [Bacteroidetes bacterium HGW-Bacteroidetes-12]|nr:MAG: hypothetical protein CVT95_11685 [Bacteroidetes bacterium HGW-Bacteroidetes-12]
MYFIEPYEITCPSIKTGTIYSFTTKSDEIYEVRFGRKEDNILHASIVFGVTNEKYDGEEYSLTNKGEVYRVMRTVVEIVKIYIREHPNVNRFEYTGEQSQKEKSKNKNIRLALYNRYIKDVFDDKWSVENINDKVIISKV